VCYEKFGKHQRRNVEEWLLSDDKCEIGFHHMTDRQTYIVNAAAKQKGEKKGGRMSEICTAVRRSLHSSQKTSDHYKLFFKITSVV
jgi:hypothetical protein